jgi:hypothetical protein
MGVWAVAGAVGVVLLAAVVECGRGRVDGLSIIIRRRAINI